MALVINKEWLYYQNLDRKNKIDVELILEFVKFLVFDFNIT